MKTLRSFEPCVRDDDVGNAIASEVGNREPDGIGPSEEAQRGFEPIAPKAQVDQHVVLAAIKDDDVFSCRRRQVGHRDRSWGLDALAPSLDEALGLAILDRELVDRCVAQDVFGLASRCRNRPGPG